MKVALIDILMCLVQFSIQLGFEDDQFDSSEVLDTDRGGD